MHPDMPNVEQQAWPHAAALRELRGHLSVESAARKIDVTRQSWASWEAGRQVPSYDNLRAIVEAFNCPPELVGYEPPRGYELVPAQWIREQNAEILRSLQLIHDQLGIV